jgi:hypothetical protein
MTEQFSFSVTDLNFDTINTSLKDYFSSTQNLSYISGSNFDIYSKINSYYTMLNSQYLSLSTNNQYVDSITNIQSMYSKSKELGYVPRRRIPSRSRINASYTPINYTSDTFTLSEISFTGKTNGLIYIAKNVTFTKQTSGVYTSSFIVEQKVLNLFSYNGTNNQDQEIILPTLDISQDSFDVKSIIGSSEYDWELINNYSLTPDENARIYFVDVSPTKQVIINFGNGIVGQVPISSEQLNIYYYTTLGTDGNGETSFDISKLVSKDSVELNNISNYIFTKSTSYGGKDYEGLDEIKLIAPKYFSSLGNNIIEKDYEVLLEISEDYVKYSNLAIVNYQSGKLSNDRFLDLIPLDYRTEDETKKDDNYPNGTFPFSELTNLVVSNVVYENIKLYNNDWINIDLISPNYLYCNITPLIEVKYNKNVNIVGKQIFENLLPLFNDTSIDDTTSLFGYNKTYRDSTIIKNILSNSSVKSAQIQKEFSLATSLNNITDKNFIKIPQNFLSTNSNYFDNLIKYSNYSYTELKKEDSTIFIDSLKNSELSKGDQFTRNIISSDYTNVTKSTNIFELEFDNSNNLVKKDMTTFYINNNLISVEIYPYLIKSDSLNVENESTIYTNEYFTKGYIPSIYSSDIIQEATSNSQYNYTKNLDVYFVYFNYKNTKYLIGEIIKYVDPIETYIFKKVDDLFAINKLFGLLGIENLVSKKFLSYTFKNNNIFNNLNIINTTSISGNIAFFTGNITNENQMNLKISSRKSIMSVTLLTIPEVELIDEDLFSYTLDQASKTITLLDNSENEIAIFSYNDFEITLLSSNNYIGNDFETYKNNLFTFEQSGNIISVYSHENIHDANLGLIDIERGVIFLNDIINYIPDYNDTLTINTNFLDLMKELFETSTIYKMIIISKNNLGEKQNIIESFDIDDNVFMITNLNQSRELTI